MAADRCADPSECFDSRCDVDCRLLDDTVVLYVCEPCQSGACHHCTGCTCADDDHGVCQCLRRYADGHVPGCPLWEEKRA